MELRHLRYMIAIAEELHFTRAAERLGIAQPPLSQQIKQLEAEVGTPLFHRSARAVTLTEAGHAFLPHARDAVDEADRAIAAAQRAARGDMGHLRVGFTSSASFNPLVPGIVRRFGELYPDVTVDLAEQATSQLLDALRDERLDVAFLRATASERDGLETVELPAEELWVALPSRHPLATQKRIDLLQLAGEAFVLYPRANGRLLYDTMVSACRNAGFSPRIAQEAPQMASTVHLVAAGVGVALVPASMCQLHASGVTYVRIAGDVPRAQLWLAWPAHVRLSAAAHNLVALVRQDLGPLRRRRPVRNET